MFILDYDNLIYKKAEINYDDKFKNNKILKGKIKEKYLEVRIFFLKKKKIRKGSKFFFKKIKVLICLYDDRNMNSKTR
jgi:hypothetical protein